MQPPHCSPTNNNLPITTKNNHNNFTNHSNPQSSFTNQSIIQSSTICTLIIILFNSFDIKLLHPEGFPGSPPSPYSTNHSYYIFDLPPGHDGWWNNPFIINRAEPAAIIRCPISIASPVIIVDDQLSSTRWKIKDGICNIRR
ncbi:hypothetical protein DFA_05784 [Cavenderia fasciculata]|uniref:Uncharacterized protein n=1 Tax=Cavenderia fasciculata TaxID=261658 RepID=F4PMK3_CACFS|nr:uncharacterized protein DFA_05784 [Cavenderia fasciculata]EGG23650.1 hypothetical protein DFA_05784 [Cavenderia fasciculata]|eukprot:XP_004361501.1 hypothetical protein DFA_05784 [Cavenderia fasciculata]